MAEPLGTLPLATIGQPRAEALRQILDHFSVRARLDEIRAAVWQGGEVRFMSRSDELRPDKVLDAAYELRATWDTAVLDQGTLSPALVPTRGGTSVDGRWIRAQARYVLRVGIEIARVPNALYLRGRGLRYFVPFVGRSDAQIANALDDGLGRYASAFLDRFPPVPEAVADAEHLLRLHGL